MADDVLEVQPVNDNTTATLRVNNSNYCDDSALQESFCADIHDTNWNALNPEDRNARLVDAYCQSGITQDSGADASFYDNYWIQLHDPT